MTIPARRQPEKRRQQIMRAAVRLFARRGYTRTTTREIAQVAGVAEGTIFNYFASKQDLLLAFLEEAALRPLAECVISARHPTDEAFLACFLESRLALWERKRSLLKVVFGEALFDPTFGRALGQHLVAPLIAMLEAHFAQRVAEGAFREVDPRLAAQAIVGMVLAYNLLLPMLQAPGERRRARGDLAQELASLLLDGLRARAPGKGRARW